MTNIKQAIVIAVSALLLSTAAMAQDGTTITKHTSISITGMTQSTVNVRR